MPTYTVHNCNPAGLQARGHLANSAKTVAPDGCLSSFLEDTIELYQGLRRCKDSTMPPLSLCSLRAPPWPLDLWQTWAQVLKLKFQDKLIGLLRRKTGGMSPSTSFAMPWGWYPAKNCLSNWYSLVRFRNTWLLITIFRLSGRVPCVAYIYLLALARQLENARQCMLSRYIRALEECRNHTPSCFHKTAEEHKSLTCTLSLAEQQEFTGYMYTHQLYQSI